MKNTITPRRRVGLISALVAALFVPAVTAGLSAAGASSTGSTALDSSVVVTAVIPGVTGDGSVAGHGPGAIEISSWSWGATNTSSVGSGAGAGSGKVKFSEFTIKKSTDQATPILWQAMATGAHYPSVTIYFDEPGQAGAAGGASYLTYMKITLSNARITSDTISGGGGEENPTESITLNFTKVTMTYSAPGAKTTTFSWRVSLLK